MIFCSPEPCQGPDFILSGEIFWSRTNSSNSESYIYVYSGRVVHFWFHYIIKHFLYEYPVSNLLEKVKDLDAGLITKYL